MPAKTQRQLNQAMAMRVIEEPSKPWDSLIWRKKTFASYYVTNGRNATLALRDIGYSERGITATANRFLADPVVQSYINEATNALAVRAAVSRDWVLAGLRKEAETGDSSAARIRAYELIGKDIGMWPKRTMAEELMGVQAAAEAGTPMPNITFNITNDFRSVQQSLLALLPPEMLAERAQGAIQYEPTDEDWDADD